MKISFIISSVGGPKMLSSVFTGKIDEQVAYVVIQRMPSEEFLEALVECLREEIKLRLRIVSGETRLKPGQVHFLSPRFDYRIEGEWVKEMSRDGNQISIDGLLASAVAGNLPCSAIVLSGMLTDRDGIEGLRKLKDAGGQILGSSPTHTPVFDMLDELRRESLVDQLFPPQYLLENVEFHPPQHVPNGSGWKILVVDDEEDVRQAICSLLQFEGAETDQAEDGLDALRKIQKTRYSAVLLDLQMPELDGIKTLEALKTMEPDLPILIVTGQGDHELEQKLQNQVEGMLIKPFTLDELRGYLPRLQKKESPSQTGPSK